ncbi:MAG: hypothetical protein ACI8W8_000493 [Rhodothermales bacterium]|jgi:hypothetical protein
MLGFQNPLIEQSLIDRVLADRPTRGEGILRFPATRGYIRDQKERD